MNADCYCSIMLRCLLPIKVYAEPALSESLDVGDRE